jgi:hypothetical protein
MLVEDDDAHNRVCGVDSDPDVDVDSYILQAAHVPGDLPCAHARIEFPLWGPLAPPLTDQLDSNAGRTPDAEIAKRNV